MNYKLLVSAIFIGIITGFASIIFFFYVAQLLGLTVIKNVDTIAIILGINIGYLVSWLIGKNWRKTK